MNVALAMTCPPQFWEAFGNLKAKRAADIDVLIEFLAADPLFFRSGYLKAKLAKLLVQINLSGDQKLRIQHALLNTVRRRNGYEFRELTKLAFKVADDRLRDELEGLKQSSDGVIAQRAKWMLMAVLNRRFKRLHAFDEAKQALSIA